MALSLGSAQIIIDGNTEGLKASLKNAKALVAESLGTAQTTATNISKTIGSAIGTIPDQILSRYLSLDTDVKSVLNGLVSGVGLLPDKFAELKESAGPALSLMQTAVGDLDISFKTLLSPIGLVQTAIGVVSNLAIDNFDVIIDFVTEWTNAFIDLYNQSIFVRIQIEAIGLVFKTLFNIVKLVVTTVIDGFSTIGKVIKAAINGDLSDIPDLIKGYFKQAAADTLDTGAAIGEDVGEAINSALFNRLENVSRDDVKGFLDNFRTIGEEAASRFIKPLQGIGNIAPIGVTSIADTGTQFDFYKDIQKDLIAATELQKVFGNSFDIVGEKTKILENGINSLINNGFKRGSTEVQFLIDQLDGVANPLRDIQAELNTATELQRAFGNSFDIVEEKRAILENGIASLIENGFKASSNEVRILQQELATLSETAIISAQDMAALTGEAVSDFANSIAESITTASSLGDILEGVNKSIFLTMAKILSGVGDAAIKIGATMLAVKSALNFGNPAVAIATGIALKVFSGTIKNLLSDTPKLAKGGLAFGETLAVVGDNPNASVDPEVIAPLSKLKGYLADAGGGGSQTLRAVISGSDLILVSDRAAITDNIITGR